MILESLGLRACQSLGSRACRGTGLSVADALTFHWKSISLREFGGYKIMNPEELPFSDPFRELQHRL